MEVWDWGFRDWGWGLRGLGIGGSGIRVSELRRRELFFARFIVGLKVRGVWMVWGFWVEVYPESPIPLNYIRNIA